MTIYTGVNRTGTKLHHIDPAREDRPVGNRRYLRARCSQLVLTLKDDIGLRTKRGLSRVNYSELPICNHCEYIAKRKEPHQ